MDIAEINAQIGGLPGVLALKPGPGDGFPELAWGDAFFYYAPDGVLPKTQPFATVVTKDYPDDAACRLDRPDAFRVNLAVGRQRFTAETGTTPRDADPERIDYADDVLLPHPVYCTQGWLCVTNPGPGTAAVLPELESAAHERARAAWRRRATR